MRELRRFRRARRKKNRVHSRCKASILFRRIREGERVKERKL